MWSQCKTTNFSALRIRTDSTVRNLKNRVAESDSNQSIVNRYYNHS